jgi:hypothetical protein
MLVRACAGLFMVRAMCPHLPGAAPSAPTMPAPAIVGPMETRNMRQGAGAFAPWAPDPQVPAIAAGDETGGLKGPQGPAGIAAALERV